VYHSLPDVPDITSRQHPLVHAFKSAARHESDEVLLDGWHLLHDAAAAGIDIRAVAVTGSPASANDAALINQLARQCDVFTVSAAVMDAMSPVRTPVGVVALASRRAHATPRLLQPAPALVVVAADIQDPGNVGAIIRSAEAGGATGVVFAGTSADPWGWKALRAAMGSTFRLPVTRMPEVRPILEELRAAGLQIIATVTRAHTELQRFDLRPPTAVLVGGEGSGLDLRVVELADDQLSIPMRAPVESLNVAVATALIIYEANRQREA
jgi:TrmH family RNA methyltransferase